MTLLLQSAKDLEAVQVSAKLFGPITLGADPQKAQTVCTATLPLDGLVWAANDTTGQSTADEARKGGRAMFRWTGEDFLGALPLLPLLRLSHNCSV
jgi:hypothetical protein